MTGECTAFDRIEVYGILAAGWMLEITESLQSHVKSTELTKNLLVLGRGSSCVVEAADDVGDKVSHSDEVSRTEAK